MAFVLGAMLSAAVLVVALSVWMIVTKRKKALLIMWASLAIAGLGAWGITSLVTHDPEVAALKRSAKKGDPDAMYWLAKRYMRGHGVSKNGKKANRWYEKAAEAGDARAAYELYDNYSHGWGGVPIDQEKANYWLSRSEEMGYARSRWVSTNLKAEVRADTVDRGDELAKHRLENINFDSPALKTTPEPKPKAVQQSEQSDFKPSKPQSELVATNTRMSKHATQPAATTQNVQIAASNLVSAASTKKTSSTGKYGKQVGTFYYSNEYNGQEGAFSTCIRTFFKDGKYCLIEWPGYSFELRDLGDYLYAGLADKRVIGMGGTTYRSRYEMYNEDDLNFYFRKIVYKTTYTVEFVSVGYSFITRETPSTSMQVSSDGKEVVVAKDWSYIIMKKYYSDGSDLMLPIEISSKSHDDKRSKLHTMLRGNNPEYSNQMSSPTTSTNSSSSRSNTNDRYGYRDCPGCFGTGTCQTCGGDGLSDSRYTGGYNNIECPNCCSSRPGKCGRCCGSKQVYGLK